jgi:hypothetical protein
VVRGLILAAADVVLNADEIDQILLRADELLNVSGGAFFAPQVEKLRLQLEPRE